METVLEYFEIIANRLKNPIEKGEVHHIYPKSCGGWNMKCNLVRLTPQEHYYCHKLLVKIFEDDPKNHARMFCAWHRISHSRNGVSISAEEYAQIREAHAKAVSEMLKGHKGYNKGGKRPKEIQDKINAALQADEVKRVIKAKRKLQAPPTKGKSWYHNETKTFLCFPDDPKVAELHLIPGRRR